MLDEKTPVFSNIYWMLENFQFNFILRKVEGEKKNRLKSREQICLN